MDAKEILRETINLEKYKFVDHLQGSTLDAVLEAMEEYAQSLQDKVKELESALTESKAREERCVEMLGKLYKGIVKSGDDINIETGLKNTIKHLLSSNQPNPRTINP